MKKYLSLIIVSVVIVTCLSVSCSKSFLDRQPNGTLDTTVVGNQKGVEALLIGAYSMMDGY